MSYWYLEPVGNSYVLVAAVAAVLGLLLLIQPGFGRAGAGGKRLLIGLRLLVIGLILLAMLRPARVRTEFRAPTEVLILLVDQSRSMQLPGASQGISRWQEQQTALTRATPILRELAQDMEVQIYGYDRELHPIDFSAGELELPESPEGDQTDLGTNLHRALQQELGKPVAGVIMMGDGVQTAFHPEVEIQQVSRELARLGYPLFTVPFGAVGDVAQARDVAVENLPDQYTVFVKNELPVRAAVRVRGYVNRPIPVELEVTKPDGESRVVGPVEVTATEDDQRVPVELRYIPPVSGRYRLTMRAAEQPGELVTENNQLSAYLRVLEGGLRVLYLEGTLRSESRFLRQSLADSADIELDYLWLDPRLRDRWPVDLEERLTDARYDVFLLGDLDSTALGETNLQLLAEAVEAGKGLVLLGGYHSFGPGGYRDTPLADVMPILMDRFERQDFDAPIREDLHVPGPLSMRPIRDHPIVRLADNQQNASVWERLPPLTGANRFTGVKDAAGTMVIAESDEGEPLLVVGEPGRGRVAAMAADSTWRWWMLGHQGAHQRFWRQMILWLVRRDDLEQNEVWIQLAQRRYYPGGRVTFLAGARSPSGAPLEQAVLEAQLIGPDGDRRPLRLVRDAEQWRGAIDAVTEPGEYVIEISGEQEGEPIGSAQGEFLVFDHDVELANPAADHGQLARLSAVTREAGGRLIAPEELPSLLEELRDRPPELEIEVQTRWQLADTSGDAWGLLLVFVGLLGAEWALRKRWAMV